MTLSQIVPWGRSRDIPVRHSQRGGNYSSSLLSLQEDMNRMLEEFLGQEMSTEMADLPRMPSIDLVENEKDFKVKVELAGMDTEDINVEVTDDVLTLSGERQEETEDQSEQDKDRGGYLRREISYGSFKRTIPLPQSANGKEANATFKNGILTIDVPKKPESIQQPRKLDIKKSA